jgi:acyl-CoA thioesterase
MRHPQSKSPPASASRERVVDCLVGRTLVAREWFHLPDKTENILASVEDQCQWLREIGFQDVDCFFKLLQLGVRRDKTGVNMSTNFNAIKHHFENDRFAASSGMRLLELRPGFARTALAIEERHLNNVGTVQGGAIFTLADFAFGAASKTGGKVAVAVNTNLSFLKATRSGALYAEATEVSRSRKLSVCTVHVTNDAGELVALFQGTAYIKDEPFPPESRP